MFTEDLLMREQLRQLIKPALLILLAGIGIGVLLSLMGCATTYTAERTNTDGSSTSLSVKSFREFKGGIMIEYEREKGAFRLEAGEVTNDDSVVRAVEALAPAIIRGTP